MQNEQNAKNASERLQGNVVFWNPVKQFGFIKATKEGNALLVKYQFHRNALRHRGAPIGSGVVVEFSPLAIKVEGKCDKATDIVVVG